MKLIINLKSNCDFWQLSQANLEYLKKKLDFLEIIQMTDNEEENIELIESADFYFGWDFKKEWIEKAKSLKLIIIPSAGKDYMPLEELEEAKIPVITGTGYHAMPMVEQIMLYILGFSRGVFQTFNLKEKEEWWKPQIKESFFDINGETMTILGCGAVGKKLAKTAKEFGLNTIGIRRNINQIEDYIEWHTPDYMEEAFKRSKIVVNLLPLTKETEYIIDKDMFEKMKGCKIFINIGRGKTVNEKDLQWALENKLIEYCAMDVYDEKPPKMDNPLRFNNNVVLTPKTGVFFYKYMEYATKYLVITIKKYLNIVSGMNLKYAEKEYVYRAIMKYFKSDRMNNLIDFNRDDLLSQKNIMNMCNLSKEEIIDRYTKTERNWPFLAFTINSMCNRQCIFCDAKNEEKDLLTLEDYRKIARVSNSWNITKAHLSGGEPTIRKDVVEIVKILNEEIKSPNKQIGITTNGSCSYELIDRLIEAGMTNFNFSVHSLNEDNYKSIMGAGDPNDVINKVKYCLDKNMKVKVNCTVLRSYVQDAIEMLQLAKRYKIDLRFVELQEIGPARDFFDQEFISEKEFLEMPKVKKIMKGLIGEKERKIIGVRSPGKYYELKEWKGTFAFISNTSKPVCADGNRIKITPTGRLRPCTLENCDLNLKEYLDNNQEDEAYRKTFFSLLNRENNPCHRGFHYIDYDLRWDNYKFKDK